MIHITRSRRIEDFFEDDFFNKNDIKNIEDGLNLLLEINKEQIIKILDNEGDFDVIEQRLKLSKNIIKSKKNKKEQGQLEIFPIINFIEKTIELDKIKNTEIKFKKKQINKLLVPSCKSIEINHIRKRTKILIKHIRLKDIIKDHKNQNTRSRTKYIHDFLRLYESVKKLIFDYHINNNEINDNSDNIINKSFFIFNSNVLQNYPNELILFEKYYSGFVTNNFITEEIIEHEKNKIKCNENIKNTELKIRTDVLKYLAHIKKERRLFIF